MDLVQALLNQNPKLASPQESKRLDAISAGLVARALGISQMNEARLTQLKASHKRRSEEAQRKIVNSVKEAEAQAQAERLEAAAKLLDKEIVAPEPVKPTTRKRTTKEA